MGHAERRWFFVPQSLVVGVGDRRSRAVGIREPCCGRLEALSRRAEPGAAGDLPALAHGRTGQAYRDERPRIHPRLCHRLCARHSARLSHGDVHAMQTGNAALGLGPLCHTDRRARPALHPLVRHRDRFQTRRRRRAGRLSGGDQHRNPDCAQLRSNSSKPSAASGRARVRFSSRSRCRPRFRSFSPASSSASGAA